MFVRKKKNRSGTVSVVVTDKSGGKYRELKTVGVSSDAEEIARLEVKARQWIDEYPGQLTLDFDESARALQEARNTIARIERTLQNTPQAILGHIYDSIGFGAIGDSILRHLVIARVCQPQSKVATVEYLKSYFDEDVRLHSIYRYMDKLYNTQREKVQQISVGHTMRILGGQIGIVFYDVTTLYFESAPHPDDALRQAGFSKDGKTAESQIVLGLLVSEDGYPMSYSIFNGSQYEGRTMIPIIDDFVQRFKLTDFIVVADSGLMNTKNVELLDTPGVLWPKFEDPNVGDKLAFTGGVKDLVVDIELLAMRLLSILAQSYPQMLADRYRMTETAGLADYELLELLGKKRGMLMRGGEVDTLRAATTLLDEFRAGKLGRLSFEAPPTEGERADDQF